MNAFGLIMAIVGTRYATVWFLDPTGAICIACLILYSWASTAFEHMWYLVGKTAPQDFLNKLVYVSVTHDERIRKIDTVCANSFTAPFSNKTRRLVPTMLATSSTSRLI